MGPAEKDGMQSWWWAGRQLTCGSRAPGLLDTSPCRQEGGLSGGVWVGLILAHKGKDEQTLA